MRWFILAVLIAVSVVAQEVVTQTITYPSSVSNLTLDALVFTDNKTGPKPILVVMHSYAGTMADVVDVGQRFAQAGILVVAPNMRGRSTNQSYTLGDDSMYDLFDVYDAIIVAAESFSGDKDNINILGYSGGGANVMAMVQKFPDLFSGAYSFFGIPNYCDGDSWFQDGRYDRKRLSQRIGDGSGDLSMGFHNRCLARNSLKQIPNAKKTRVRLYVDKDETVAPLEYSQEYAWQYQQRGFLLNVHLDVSDKTTQIRYTHGYPKDVPDLRVPELSIAQEVIYGKQDVSLAKKGTLNVGGYVKTKPFSVFLGDEVFEGNASKGREGLVELEYDLEESEFSFVDKSYAPGIRNVTIIMHGNEPGEKVRITGQGANMKSVANEKGDASFFVPIDGSVQSRSTLGFVGAAIALVLIVAAGFAVRKKFR